MEKCPGCKPFVAKLLATSRDDNLLSYHGTIAFGERFRQIAVDIIPLLRCMFVAFDEIHVHEVWLAALFEL